VACLPSAEALGYDLSRLRRWFCFAARGIGKIYPVRQPAADYRFRRTSHHRESL